MEGLPGRSSHREGLGIHPLCLVRNGFKDGFCVLRAVADDPVSRIRDKRTRSLAPDSANWVSVQLQAQRPTYSLGRNGLNG